jgi:glycosyltransferase involved in cell wall biosynthesis
MSTVRRFAIVSPNFYPRVCGVGDHSARLGDEIRRRGHEVIVFSRLPVSPNPEAPALEVRGVAGWLPTTIARHVGDAIAAARPTDVVLQYTAQMWNTWRFGSPALVWLAERARRAGARVTLIAHELFSPWPARPDLILVALTQRVQLAALLSRCDYVFVTTDTRVSAIAGVCRLLHAPVPGVLRVGANALPMERRARGALTPEAEVRIGLFSTAAVGKRFDVVLDAFARVAREWPSAQLSLIGELGSPERPDVRQILDAVRRHPATDRIRLTGKLSLAEVAAQIVALDVYLFPIDTGANTRSSTLPIALGSGLPVVAVQGPETDVELFRDGENIVFVPELTADAFAEGVLRLLRERGLSTRVGQGARRLYADHLSWPRIADHLLTALGADGPEQSSRQTS